MREIKFRVYIKNMEGFNAPYFEKIGRIFDVYEIDFEAKEVSFRTPSLEYLSFKDCVLLQYTGLKDKNGVEVYEGDILIIDDEDIVVVEWLDDGFVLIGENYQADPMYPYTRNGLWDEVIGNLYENPELLKREN